ncbi:MAG: M28 family peptidase [Ignavibacteriales bacterium]|nr:M28 family peptidase [Ignavibacteriales bacterium]
MMILLSLPLMLLQLVPPNDALNAITAEKLRTHIAVLSHDSLEGRGPASKGDAKATAYIVSQFKKFGLLPAGENGTYLQKVPMVGVTVDPKAALNISKGKQNVALAYSTDFVVATGIYEPTITITNAELVFVGYGIVAPEQQWDDYKDVDVRGKIIVMMNNDPSSDDPKFFAGKGRTYYGRWTYKYEIAAEKGALGAIVIHTTPSAGYRYEVIRNSWSREMFDLEEKSTAPALRLKAWTTEEATRKYFQLAGYSLDSLMKLAEERTFKPIPLGITLSTSMKTAIKRLETNNIVGKITGSDPVLKDQYLIFSAHYDHFGIGIPVDGDSIYNGALDNASGTSLMLNFAEIFSSVKEKPKRSLLFAAVAAEEQGLLGSKYFANNPTVPARQIAANINTDVINTVGPTRDIFFQGSDRSSLGNDLAMVAKEMGLTVRNDPAPEQGGFYRSDHFSFAKVGIPAMSMGSGRDVVGVDTAIVRMMRERGGKNYHQPSDEMYDDWNYNGALQQAEIVLRIAWRVANIIEMPYWNAGDEFGVVRRKSLEIPNSK